jgi:hypothetical protein
MPGGSFLRRPTWFSTFTVFNRAGFFCARSWAKRPVQAAMHVNSRIRFRVKRGRA